MTPVIRQIYMPPIVEDAGGSNIPAIPAWWECLSCYAGGRGDGALVHTNCGGLVVAPEVPLAWEDFLKRERVRKL